MSEIDIHELAAAYALDALDPAERAAYEAHFTTCAMCRTQVGEFREAAAELTTLTAAGPPAALRSRVLADIAGTRQIAPVVRLDAHRRRRAGTALVAVAAATLAVLVGAFVVLRGGDPSFNDQVAAMMDEPSARVAELAGEEGSVKLVWDDVHVAVMADALPAPADGRRYELWLIDAAGAHPMRLLDSAPDGTLRRILEVPDGMTASAWGVTLEPDSGSATPTMPILYHSEA